jgi:glycosyltransferase involved in cell wall biosynthesis
MLEKDMKVFIGPVEIANIGATLASALRERGTRVTVVTTRRSPFSAGMKYDKVLDFQDLSKLRKAFRYLYHFPEFFFRHNTFVFLFGTSLLPYNLDLPLLKLFCKKTVMWFVGSDIRHYESLAAAAEKAGIQHYMSEEYLRMQREAGPKALKRKLRMIHMAERYVDHIISGPSYSQLLSREYSRFYAPLDFRTIRYNSVPNSRPIVVHAPTSEGKGTSYVVEAVERLKKEGYDFEFCLLRNTSNAKVREMLSKADIAVDQLFDSGPGMFALESMAAGCAVLGGNIPEFSGFPKDLPIVHSNPDNVYQNLKTLLENPELRRELGEKGREYVEKYNDSRKIADDIVKLITQDQTHGDSPQ